jgi:hypothetical protein
VRGLQLGGAINATVRPNATTADCKAHDVIVVVKRCPDELLRSIRASGKPWVYDIIDSYPQPLAGTWTKEQAQRWVWQKLADYSPDRVIWPNMKMRHDCDGASHDLTLPHHYWPAMTPNPIREKVKLVNYEGSQSYLGVWEHWIHKECSRRNWCFSINAASYNAADIVVAFRDGEYNGYVQRHFKSGIKLANAHGSGTPFVGQIESGYLESATGFEQFVSTPKELISAFDFLEDWNTRKNIQTAFLANKYPLEKAANVLLEYLKGVVESC